MNRGIAGLWISRETTRATIAELRVVDQELVVSDRNETVLTRSSPKEIEISARLGEIPRRINFSNGSHFETEENELVDELLRSCGKSSGFLHKLEGKLHFILFAILITVGTGFGFLFVGLPYLAKIVAEQLPMDLLNHASKSTLKTLDHLVFEPSDLTVERRKEISSMIRKTLPQSQNDSFRILFRRGENLGANAFALPDGSIIFTDELVGLLKTDDEIFAVFAHELGHVVQRHSLRQLLQSATIAILSFLVIGEATDGMLEAINALPALLMNSSYSRKFESEADDYAIALLQELDISPHHLGKALERLSHYHSEEEGIKYLQSHPPTDERILKTRYP